MATTDTTRIEKLADFLFELCNRTRSLEAAWANVKECREGTEMLVAWGDEPPRSMRTASEVEHATAVWQKESEDFDWAVASALAAVPGVDGLVRKVLGTRPGQWGTNLNTILRNLRGEVTVNWGHQIHSGPQGDLARNMLGQVVDVERWLRAVDVSESTPATVGKNRRRADLKEVDKKAWEWMERDKDFGLRLGTKEWASILGCGVGSVPRLSAWDKAMELRGKPRRRKGSHGPSTTTPVSLRPDHGSGESHPAALVEADELIHRLLQDHLSAKQRAYLNNLTDAEKIFFSKLSDDAAQADYLGDLPDKPEELGRQHKKI